VAGAAPLPCSLQFDSKRTTSFQQTNKNFLLHCFHQLMKQHRERKDWSGREEWNLRPRWSRSARG